MRFKLLLLIFFMAVRWSVAQNPVGQWINHQSYCSAIKIIDTDDLVYCVTKGGYLHIIKTTTVYKN